MGGDWVLVESYREAGRTHRFPVESGLTMEEAKEMAAEFNENMEVMGVTGHRCEVMPERRPS